MKTVKDLNTDNHSWSLVTDSQEIEAVIEQLDCKPATKAKYRTQFSCMFVNVGDGAYAAVYGCVTSVPWLNSPVRKLKTH